MKSCNMTWCNMLVHVQQEFMLRFNLTTSYHLVQLRKLYMSACYPMSLLVVACTTWIVQCNKVVPFGATCTCEVFPCHVTCLYIMYMLCYDVQSCNNVVVCNFDDNTFVNMLSHVHVMLRCCIMYVHVGWCCYM